ncbi:MAG: His-Xaa-Ser system protein HxsD [Muribaculaceae bacterium]|nr:His-Xaa-Ser system protein HxsD [Muribaculaceae bacterium]
MKITVDRRIYSDSVVSKAVYSLSGRFTVARTLVDEHTERIESEGDSEGFVEEMLQALNDFKLRQIVADETRDVKTILYAAAFGGDDTFSIEDVRD